MFGSPTCIWNGGRTLANVYYNKEQLQKIHDTYAELGITVRFIFTNPLLTEYDLHDRYCNLVMDIFKDVSPEVVVNSPMLEDYLRNKYPTASFISSTTKRLRSSNDQLKEFENDYRYVCLDYDYNYDMCFLDSITEENRSRVEILVNSVCPKACNVRHLHQKFSAKSQLEFSDGGKCDDDEPFYKDCPLTKRIESIPFSQKGKTKGYLRETNYIFPQDLDTYLDRGYSHFKLQGRELPANLLFAEIFPYLIRPRFYTDTISMLSWK